MARVGRRNKTKFVLHKELVILIVVLVAMIVTAVCLSIPSASEKRLAELNNAITQYNTANNTSYTELNDDTTIRKVSLKTIDSAIKGSENGTDEEPKYVYVIYGSLENSTILQYLSVIDEEAKNREVKTVYLYSSEKVDNQEDKDDASFLAGLKNDSETFNRDVLEGVDEVDLLKPTALYVYKNGELVFNSTPIVEDGSYDWKLIINNAFSK